MLDLCSFTNRKNERSKSRKNKNTQSYARLLSKDDYLCHKKEEGMKSNIECKVLTFKLNVIF